MYCIVQIVQEIHRMTKWNKGKWMAQTDRQGVRAEGGMSTLPTPTYLGAGGGRNPINQLRKINHTSSDWGFADLLPSIGKREKRLMFLFRFLYSTIQKWDFFFFLFFWLKQLVAMSSVCLSTFLNKTCSWNRVNC